MGPPPRRPRDSVPYSLLTSSPGIIASELLRRSTEPGQRRATPTALFVAEGRISGQVRRAAAGCFLDKAGLFELTWGLDDQPCRIGESAADSPLGEIIGRVRLGPKSGRARLDELLPRPQATGEFFDLHTLVGRGFSESLGLEREDPVWISWRVLQASCAVVVQSAIASRLIVASIIPNEGGFPLGMPLFAMGWWKRFQAATILLTIALAILAGGGGGFLLAICVCRIALLFYQLLLEIPTLPPVTAQRLRQKQARLKQLKNRLKQAKATGGMGLIPAQDRDDLKAAVTELKEEIDSLQQGGYLDETQADAMKKDIDQANETIERAK